MKLEEIFKELKIIANFKCINFKDWELALKCSFFMSLLAKVFMLVLQIELTNTVLKYGRGISSTSKNYFYRSTNLLFCNQHKCKETENTDNFLLLDHHYSRIWITGFVDHVLTTLYRSELCETHQKAAVTEATSITKEETNLYKMLGLNGTVLYPNIWFHVQIITVIEKWVQENNIHQRPKVLRCTVISMGLLYPKIFVIKYKEVG